ncbi:MAG: gliding motility-associated protein GldE [Flavobacteriales bacterium]|nr:gliding motility-associated protein GldE [Flavobacteriales bacterium]MCB9173811.1 gliding motility-associated protein GldE [Flavobacteriales bacterium]
MVSGSEVALFSLAPADLDKIKDAEDKGSANISIILNQPKYLLATILIVNNAVNIAIIILSTLTLQQQFNFSALPYWLDFAIQVIGITFLILLFGEIVPKVYATKNALKIALLMALPLKLLIKVFKPISFLLIYSTNFFDKNIKRKTHDISVEELSHAIDLTNDIHSNQQEHQILKGIVKFGETSVKEVMTARVNVVSIEKETPFNDIIKTILDSGHSRIPVYEDSFDKILGVLYIKDIIPHINKDDNFDWLPLLRNPFFIPENKKLDDLLKEFQERKIHLAIIVDEYGGTSGIITLEDIIEEIVGEISDEFDTEDIVYSKLDDSTYVFDGNTTINDLNKIIILDDNTIFTEMKKEAETLAGLIIEISGKIPQKNEKVNFHHFSFIIEASDKRRVKRVKLIINKA